MQVYGGREKLQKLLAAELSYNDTKAMLEDKATVGITAAYCLYMLAQQLLVIIYIYKIQCISNSLPIIQGKYCTSYQTSVA